MLEMEVLVVRLEVLMLVWEVVMDVPVGVSSYPLQDSPRLIGGFNAFVVLVGSSSDPLEDDGLGGGLLIQEDVLLLH